MRSLVNNNEQPTAVDSSSSWYNSIFTGFLGHINMRAHWTNGLPSWCLTAYLPACMPGCKVGLVFRWINLWLSSQFKIALRKSCRVGVRFFVLSSALFFLPILSICWVDCCPIVECGLVFFAVQCLSLVVVCLLYIKLQFIVEHNYFVDASNFLTFCLSLGYNWLMSSVRNIMYRLGKHFTQERRCNAIWSQVSHKLVTRS